MTSCQAYYYEELKLYIFQVRSGLIKGRRDEFLDDVLAWCKERQVGEIIMLGSSSAEERLDCQLLGTQLRYVTDKDSNKEVFKQLGWTALERRERFPGLEAGKTPNEEDGLFLPGGGYAKAALLKAKDFSIPSTLLFTFCSEGDNSRDAATLIQYFNEWKKLLSKNGEGQVALRMPPSWDLLFGNPVSRGIF